MPPRSRAFVTAMSAGLCGRCSAATASISCACDVIVAAITLVGLDGLTAGRMPGAEPLGEWRGTFDPGTPGSVDLKGRTFVHGEISPHAR